MKSQHFLVGERRGKGRIIPNINPLVPPSLLRSANEFINTKAEFGSFPKPTFKKIFHQDLREHGKEY